MTIEDLPRNANFLKDLLKNDMIYRETLRLTETRYDLPNNTMVYRETL